MRTTSHFGSVANFAGRWVHKSVLTDREIAASHASFIANHLLGGLAALMVFPLWLAANQGITAFQAGVFVWLILPIALAAFVSRSGRLDVGVITSLVALSGFIVWFSLLSGGLGSGILFWLCILPVEAALFGGRKTVLVGLAAAILGFGLLVLVQLAVPGMIYQGTTNSVYTYSVFGALLYSAFLAYRIERRREKSSAKFVAEESKFRLLADNSTDLVTLHAQNGDVRFASSICETLLNSKPAALVGSGMFDKIHVHDRVAFLTAFSDAGRTGKEVSVSYRINVSDGAKQCDMLTKWMETRCRKILDPESGVVEIVAVTRDISMIKETEALLSQQRREAEKSNEAKSRFLANISHELRTPLNAIIGFSDILKQELFGIFEFEKHSEYANLINESGHHLLNLVTDILDISKIEAGRYEVFPEPFDLAKMVSSTCAMLEPQAISQNVEIINLVAADFPDIVADSRACKQMLINLLSNAIKFSHEGGRVEVEAEMLAGVMSLRVRDQGIGISEDHLKEIGKPFYQVESAATRRFEGTGLGLFLVKGLVELHDGNLNIESQLGQGTCVQISLPMEIQKSRPVPADENRTLVRLQSPMPVGHTRAVERKRDDQRIKAKI